MLPRSGKIICLVIFLLLFLCACSCNLETAPQEEQHSARNKAHSPALTEKPALNPEAREEQLGITLPEAPEPPWEESTSAPGADLDLPLVAITFDDGFATDYHQAYPLLEERDMVATTYITTGLIGKEDHLTWDQVLKLNEAEWTIGCHTHSHPHLTELDPEEVVEELEQVDSAFMARGLHPPAHHAYLFGAYNEQVIEKVSCYRQSGRAITGGVPPEPGSLDLYRLQAHQVYLDDERELAELKQLIEETATNRGILILYTHEVKTDPGPYGADPHYLARLLDHLKEQGFTAVNMEQLYCYLARKTVDNGR